MVDRGNLPAKLIDVDGFKAARCNEKNHRNNANANQNPAQRRGRGTQQVGRTGVRNHRDALKFDWPCEVAARILALSTTYFNPARGAGSPTGNNHGRRLSARSVGFVVRLTTW